MLKSLAPLHQGREETATCAFLPQSSVANRSNGSVRGAEEYPGIPLTHAELGSGLCPARVLRRTDVALGIPRRGMPLEGKMQNPPSRRILP
jgi:hypothetical protein